MCRPGLIARAIAALLIVSASAGAVSAPAGAIEDLVDPLIGSAGQGSCMPGPCLPHASIYPSPDTLRPTPGGYRDGADIVGFAQLHTQGTGGTPSYGNFLITPTRSVAIATEAERASPKADEVAQACSYSVRLTKPDVRVEVVPARHSALYRFTFPAADDSHLLLDVARKVGGAVALDEGSVRIDAAHGTITGGGQFSHNWNPASYRLFFAARVSATPAAFGTWVGATVQEGVAEAATKPGAATPPANGRGQNRSPSLGAYLRFNTTPDQPVYLKIAVSFTSAEQAQRWLDAEIPAWDFDRLRAAAAAEWRRALGAVALDGAPPDEARKLYTALWHAMVQPRDRTGDMPGFDPAEPLWDDHYTLWDTWKTLFPLMAILQPETVRDNIRSFITRHNKNADGYVAEAFIQGREFKVGQGGNETDNVIADAFAKKIPGVDWAQAYAVMKHHAEHGRTANYREHGWVASDEQTDYSWRLKSGSGTLAFAYNDYNIAQVAKGLGKTADYERYLARSQNWRNVWDDSLEVEGFRGFVHSRLLDGTFLSPTATAGQNPGRREREGYNRDFYEGSWWEYSNDVPHDLPGLIEKMGGREACLRRLIHAFRRGYIDFGNEPSFMTPWLFDRLQRPYLASFWADRLRRQFTDRDLPGDDDDGAMSSLYVFLTAGFFPIAGQDVYYLHGARVPQLAFHLTNGNTFTVLAENAGPENIFVQSATLNGRSLDTPAIHHADIVAGGTLKFVMSAQPSAWGTGGEFDPAAAARELAPVVVQKPGE